MEYIGLGRYGQSAVKFKWAQNSSALKLIEDHHPSQGLIMKKHRAADGCNRNDAFDLANRLGNRVIRSRHRVFRDSACGSAAWSTVHRRFRKRVKPSFMTKRVTQFLIPSLSVRNAALEAVDNRWSYSLWPDQFACLNVLQIILDTSANRNWRQNTVRS